jgi:hypothetical protein
MSLNNGRDVLPLSALQRLTRKPQAIILLPLEATRANDHLFFCAGLLPVRMV